MKSSDQTELSFNPAPAPVPDAFEEGAIPTTVEEADAIMREGIMILASVARLVQAGDRRAAGRAFVQGCRVYREAEERNWYLDLFPATKESIKRLREMSGTGRARTPLKQAIPRKSLPAVLAAAFQLACNSFATVDDLADAIDAPDCLREIAKLPADAQERAWPEVERMCTARIAELQAAGAP